jgi:two-component system NtrC family sensor kinase
MAVSTFFIQRMVRRPVSRLYDGTRRVAGGDLDVQVEIADGNELGDLARAFNTMTADLKRARGELTDWSDKLEHKVVEKTEELGRTQRQMVQMEKMASLGKLAATVAHELNNPLAGILTYSKLVKREIDDDTACAEGRADTLRYLDLIQKESSRCGSIVKNLLLFSRRSGVDFAPVHLVEVIERGTMLVRHHLEMANVKLEKVVLASDDTVICDPNQIEQALLALLVNGVEAMSAGSGGTLTVRLLSNPESVDVEVQDTGYGISSDVLPHIFEPFFSTKDKESGVGLGLAVVYGIVQRHSGTIDVVSTVGEGTTFRMRLPRRPLAPSEAASRPDVQRIPA